MLPLKALTAWTRVIGVARELCALVEPRALASLDVRCRADLIRRLSAAVIAHQADRLADDATLVLFQWHGPPPQG